MSDEALSSVYASCELLEGRLDLSYETIDVCCGFNESPIHIPFKDFRIDDLKQLRQRTIERIREGTEATCLTCPQLKTKEWRSNGLISSVNIHHFTKCNLKCVYCFTVLDDQTWIKERWENRYSAYDVLKSVIDAGELSRDAHVIWAGGEPTITKEFDSVIELIIGYGAYVDVYTNCVRYSDSLASAVETNPDRVYILCSVDAGTPETYDRVKGANVLTKVWENIKLYNKDRAAVIGKYIFIDEGNSSPTEIRAFIDGCIATGTKRIVIDVDVYQVRQNGWVTPSMYVDPIVLMTRLALANGISVDFGEGVRCRDVASRQALEQLVAESTLPNQAWLPHLKSAFQFNGLENRDAAPEGVRTLTAQARWQASAERIVAREALEWGDAAVAGYFLPAEGSFDGQWNSLLKPLLDRHPIDFTHTVDLACGRGRGAERLSQLAKKVTAVDVNPENVAACRERFAGRPQVEIIRNSGFDLADIRDCNVTFLYSFDAMVHFNFELVMLYIKEIARILDAGGYGLVHHSNYTATPGGDFRANPYYRNFMSAKLFAHLCLSNGLEVLDQKLLEWGGIEDLDCITVFRKMIVESSF